MDSLLRYCDKEYHVACGIWIAAPIWAALEGNRQIILLQKDKKKCHLDTFSLKL